MASFPRTQDTTRSGQKANEKQQSRNKIAESATPVPILQNVDDCPTDHESVSRLVYLSGPKAVKKCYICDRTIHEENVCSVVVDEYLFRSFYDKPTKQTKLGLEKSWAYYQMLLSPK